MYEVMRLKWASTITNVCRCSQGTSNLLVTLILMESMVLQGGDGCSLSAAALLSQLRFLEQSSFHLDRILSILLGFLHPTRFLLLDNALKAMGLRHLK